MDVDAFSFPGKENPTQNVKKMHSLFAVRTLPRSIPFYSTPEGLEAFLYLWHLSFRSVYGVC